MIVSQRRQEVRLARTHERLNETLLYLRRTRQMRDVPDSSQLELSGAGVFGRGNRGVASMITRMTHDTVVHSIRHRRIQTSPADGCGQAH